MRDQGLILGQEDSLEKENGNPLQYSCLENPMEGGAWWATVHRVAKSRTRLSDFTSLHCAHKIHKMDSLGGPVVKTAWVTVSIPGLGRSHMWRSNSALAPQLLSPHSKAQAPQEKKPLQ